MLPVTEEYRGGAVINPACRCRDLTRWSILLSSGNKRAPTFREFMLRGIAMHVMVAGQVS